MTDPRAVRSARRPPSTAESRRLAAANAGRAGWRRWGPYVAERAWGTVREDYSQDGDPWRYFPHEHARSRAYRWTEDGLAAVCDDEQTWCLGLTLWNGVDPFLKERLFGVDGHDGNHGEDVKEHYWYLDATPTYSWLRWRYHYPQRAFPYVDLVEENRRRGRSEPEYELADTGVFSDRRFWVVTIDYAKDAPEDLLMRVRVRNAAAEQARLHVLPTLWLRNTWAWGLPGRDATPTIEDAGGYLLMRHPERDALTLVGSGDPTALFCDNETNTARLFGAPNRSPYPKDGITDHLVHGLQTVNPAQRGTKASLHYLLDVPGGGSAELRLRLRADERPGDLGAGFTRTMRKRHREAGDFYAALTPAGTSPDAGEVLRQVLAGMLWNKQFYYFDVEQWFTGDPAGPPAPQRRHTRNRGWEHLNNYDVISVPDKWEYPWYAAWDLAFHCLPLAQIDPAFAKQQLLLLCREWYMHPNGQLPAYEWSFGEVNPPVQAWAARQVFEIDGSRDYEFLERAFQKLLLNFTWWVNREDRAGNNVFQGGFLGLDNIGPLDRSQLPIPGYLEQSDGTGWMAMYCLNMLDIALVLAEHDPTYEDMATKFLEHFAYIAAAAQALWDDSDGFFYDALNTQDGQRLTLRVRSFAGLLPLCATTTLEPETLARLPYFAGHLRWFLANKPRFAAMCSATNESTGRMLLAAVRPGQLQRMLRRLFDAEEFLSPYGFRALSKRHGAEPFVLSVDSMTATVGYEPGDSQTGLFGGNSNWRGPVWFPANYLLLEALYRFADFHGDQLTVELPTGSGSTCTLREAAREVTGRLVALFLPDATGHRPANDTSAALPSSPDEREPLWFFEYFHGETGAGLGASHQTGWTGLVADLLLRAQNPPDADGRQPGC